MTSAGHCLLTPHPCTHTSLHSEGLLHLTPFGLLLPPQRSLARSWRGESGFQSSSAPAREAVQPPPRALQRRLCPTDRQTPPPPSSPGQGESKSGAWALQIQGRHRDQSDAEGGRGLLSPHIQRWLPPPRLLLWDLNDTSPPVGNDLEGHLSGAETSLPAPQHVPPKICLH